MSGSDITHVQTAMPDPSRRTHFERYLVGEMRHAWLLDVACAGALVAAVATRSVVVWFHIVFLVLTLAALVLPFRRFVARLAVWIAIFSGLVAWSVVAGHTPSVELTELPLMTAVLVLTYLGAQARSHVVQRLERTQRELVERTENEVEALQLQLEQAQRLELIGRASQSIAHDLRNVFTVITDCTSDLVDEMHGRRAIARVHEIAGATDRGLGIASDLLISARQRPDRSASVDLAEVAQHLQPLLDRLAGKSVTVRVERPAAVLRTRIDRTSVLQILMNLVVNAAEAMHTAGLITVRCEQRVRQQPGVSPRPVALLTVTDNGSGIPDEVLAQVFESGYSTKGNDHSGLGLATVWRIVQRWGGSIEIDSTVGSGTTVRIEIPLFSEAHGALVVVGDGPARALLAEELRRASFEVLETDCALDACDLLFDADAVDIAVVDRDAAADPSLRHSLDAAGVAQIVVLDDADPATRIPADVPAARAVIAHALGGRPVAIG